MTRFHHHSTHLRPITEVAAKVLAGMALGLVFLPAAAAAVGNSPAVPVPADRWGSPNAMRPVQILRDSTHYDGSAVPTAGSPIFFDADLAGDYLFTVTGKGLMVHDLSGNLENLPPPAYTYGFGAVPTWLQSDLKFYFFEVSAPETDPDVAVTVGTGMGLLVWDFSSRGNPSVHYQDYDNSHGGPGGAGVWAARLGGKNYAFTAHGPAGVSVWNLNNAAKYTRCDYSKPATGGCTDVWMAKVPVSGFNANSVDGAGSFLAVGLDRDGLEIWNVANPAAPFKVLAGDPGQVTEVQMWQDGTKYYLATLDAKAVGGQYLTSIWDVSCVASATCASASPLSQPVAELPSNGYFLSKLTVSQSGGRTYLYAGDLDRFASGDQREFLWDVSDPETMETSVAGAQELFPDNVPGKGYPGWYYARNDTGFENFAPMAGVVRDGYLFRAAWTVLDSHQILGSAPPVANFTWSPDPVYGGQATAFTDKSSGGPSSWFWTFTGAAPSSSQSQAKNPTVTFNPTSFPATATVTLSASNEAGPSAPFQQQIQVLDPKPVVAGVSKSPTSALVCQQVTFTATGVGGRAPLAFNWVVKNSDGTQVTTGTGNPFTWDTSSQNPPNPPYTAEVTVSNSACSADCPKASTSIGLTLPPGLAISSGPSTDPFNFGTVQFRAQTVGASSWTWNFGDGTQQTFTSQSAGENPVHNYTQVGTYNVTLTVDNCIESPKTSAPLPVTVTQIDPLEIAEFQAQSQCQIGGAGGCFTVGKSITFAQTVSGTPDTYEYDWNGDGTWDQTSASPVLTHIYSQAGTFVPKMRVTRGTEPKVVVANGCSSLGGTCSGTSITVGSAAPASISIGGPTSGQTGQSLTFTAGASNCTPAANGWTWTATGVNVSDTDGSINVVFSSAGTKSITAKNSACGNATGTKNISVTAPSGGGGGGGGGGGKVTAGFSVTPAQPEVGESVTLDASTSTGSINSYAWSIDGSPVGTGKKLTHSFSTPGAHSVKLSVSGPGDCPAQVGGAAGICTDSETKTVNVLAANAVTASFQDDAPCGGQVGGGLCSVDLGVEVAFTDTSTGPVTQRSWDFGDGGTATGKTATHAWDQPGSYKVVLTVQGESNSSTAQKTYLVVGDPEPPKSVIRNVVVPWIAHANEDKALPQSSDLLVHNPADDAMTVNIVFRRRGLPEPDPPAVERLIGPHGTLYVPDAMSELFDRENFSGFLFVETLEGDAEPVVSSVNRTFQPDGRVFGQVVPGFPIDELPAVTEGGTQVLHLVGLNANADRLAYFGITNPSDRPLHYHLRFYDSLGQLISQTDEPGAIARFGQKQFQSEDLARDFGIEHLDDYRIEIVPVEGSPRPYIYGANLRRSSKDPSFLRVGRTDLNEVFLVGVLSSPGLNASLFRSDLVLGNTSGEDSACDITFTPAGFRSDPTAPMTETLPAGLSLRLRDVVSEWNVGNSVGVLRLVCANPSEVFPVVQGESYDVSRPSETYGQFMPALTREDAAEPGDPHVLAGLQQDAENRTTLWLYNPGDQGARYSVRYLDLQGNEIGAETDVGLGPGKFRQINPGNHAFGKADPGGFVVVVDVTVGNLLTAAQVVNDANDPAYIVGQ